MSLSSGGYSKYPPGTGQLPQLPPSQPDEYAPLPENAEALAPSGDTTGATDRAAIQAALTAGRPVYLVPGATYYRDIEFTGDLSLLRCVGGEATIVGVGSLDDIYVSDKIPLNASQRQADRAPASGLPRTILFLGQSNMADAPPLTIGYSELTSLLGADLLGYGTTAAAMVQVVDGSCNSRANHGGNGTGPGPGLGMIGTRLCRLIADTTGQTIRTYANAYSGLGIANFREGSGTAAYFEDGSQHGSLNAFDLMQSYVAAAGHVPQACVYIQGEANAGSTQAAYYAQLDGLWDELRAAYPGIKLYLVSTIGNFVDEGALTIGGASLAGVRKAQRQLESENPGDVFVIETLDMCKSLGHFGTNHYSRYGGSMIGSKEVAARIFAAMRGEAARASVTPVLHPQDAADCDHFWALRHTLTTTTNIISWQDDEGTDSLIVHGGTPSHVASDSRFGGRSVVNFAAADSESMKEEAISGGNQWSVACCALLNASAIGATQRCLWQVENAGTFSSRIGFCVATPGVGNSHTLFLEGVGDIEYTGSPDALGDQPHVWVVTYDGTAGESKLYYDGKLVSTLTSLANVTTGATARFRLGTFFGASFWDGPVCMTMVKAGAIWTDDEAADITRAMFAQIEHEMAELLAP